MGVMTGASLDGEDGGASLDGSDAVNVRPRASQEQHVACFIAAARSLSLITGVYLALR